MFSFGIREVISAIVDHELKGKGNPDKALHINLDVRISHYTDNESFHESRGLHLLYFCRPHMSYISAFSGITKSPFGSIREVESWKHEITHDSGWRDISVFSNLYFEMADNINKKRVEAGLEKIAPKDMHEFNSFPRGLCSWVPVEVKRDPADDYNKFIKILSSKN